jgi:hypothetical protein
MAKIDLRPMTLGEVLDRTFTLYKGNFWLFAGIVAIPYLVVVAFSLVYSSTLASSLPAAGTKVTPADFAHFFATTLGGAAVFGLVYLFVFAAAQAATVVAVSELYLGRAASLHESYRRVRGRILTVLLVMALIFLMALAIPAVPAMLFVAVRVPILAGLSFLFLPILSIVLLCRTAVAVPVAALEDKGVIDSISRSVLLTKGSAAQIFAVYVLVVFLSIVTTLVFHAPLFIAMGSPFKPHAFPLSLQILDGVASWVSGVIVAPIGTIAFSLIYYNLRIHKEAFDLQQLMASLEPGQTPAATPQV